MASHYKQEWHGITVRDNERGRKERGGEKTSCFSADNWTWDLRCFQSHSVVLLKGEVSSLAEASQWTGTSSCAHFGKPTHC